MAIELNLADTSVRLYRRKDGSVSVRLRSYLMIHSVGGGFRLSAYLNQFDCSLSLESGEVVVLDNYSYSYDCLYKMDYMVHSMRAWGFMNKERLSDTVGVLRIAYRLFSHPGQGRPGVLERIVPVLARGTVEQQYYSDPAMWTVKQGHR